MISQWNRANNAAEWLQLTSKVLAFVLLIVLQLSLILAAVLISVAFVAHVWRM